VPLNGAQRPAGRLGVLGWPVLHSRSPAMQRAALEALGLRGWSYQLLPVPPELFAETVRALPAVGFVGANVTVPHKHAALALADSASVAAREIGAANTLRFAGGAIEAENTDAPGLIAALGFEPTGRSAVVLGAGGTARAAAWALRGAGAEVAVWNRTGERASELAAALGIEALRTPRAADLLVNATTVGMDRYTSRGDALRSLGLNSDLLGGCAYLIDFVYASDPTPIVAAALELGVRAIDGLAILVAQGALSFEHWTGLPAPVEAMDAAARGAAPWLSRSPRT
jgi:shikimate dehydrogenase